MSQPWRLQQRIQRYGWDLAACGYETLWQTQLDPAQRLLHRTAALTVGERVLDVACGTGLASFEAATAVGESGSVIGVDLSGEMIRAASQRSVERGIANASFLRMDAQELEFDDASFNSVLCALGLMYVPRPERAFAEMARVLRPGGRLTATVWGERARCGWASVFPIADAEVQSEVCPMFFQLGIEGALVHECTHAGLQVLATERIATHLEYAGEREACEAVFVAGPIALAWSRFDRDTRERVCSRYVESIERWRVGTRFRIPGEFVVVTAVRPGQAT